MTFGLSAAEALPDWSHTAEDYATWRPDYPPSFYQRLAAFGVGQPGQRILDVGTGTGFVATSLAARGAAVWGTDVAAGQIAIAARRAEALGLGVVFQTSPAESSELPTGFFDAVTASQCWGYFDHEKASEEIARLLVPGGLLAITHLSWLPPASAVLRATEALMLEFTPSWSSGGWDGAVPPFVAGTPGFQREAHFVYDEPLTFTRESWRGRIRASRPVGATLSPDGVARFDAAHAELLERIAPPSFAVMHRIYAHIYRAPGAGAATA